MNATGVDSRQAWIVAIAGFVAAAVAFGVMRSFGVFFEAMSEEYGSGKGATALVFAVTSSLYFLLGSFTGPLADRVGPRPLMLFGAVTMAGGLVATAAATTVWMGYITFGLGVGVGFSCIYVPALATVTGWFERQRTAAIGLVASGGAVGVMVASPVAAALIETIGFRQTYVVFGIAVAAVLLACGLVVQRPPAACLERCDEGPAFSRRAAMRERSFALLWLSGAVVSAALFVPAVFFPSYATEHGAGNMHAAVLLGVMGAGSVLGRLAIGRMRDVDLMTVYRGSTLAMAASLALWLTSGGNLLAMWTFVLVYGISSGMVVAIFPATVAQIFGSAHAGGMMGLVYTGAVLGSLVGTPFAGVLIDVTGAFEPAIAMVLACALGAWAIARPLGRPQALVVAPVQSTG